MKKIKYIDYIAIRNIAWIYFYSNYFDHKSAVYFFLINNIAILTHYFYYKINFMQFRYLK